MFISCLMLFVIVSGMNYNQEIKENEQSIEIAENEEQFYCESICYKLHPFGIKTKCGHTFCLSCIYKMREENPSLCAYCRTPLSPDFINDYSFVNVNLQNLDNVEIEDLQNCFPVLPLLPEISCSDVLRWLSKENYIDINFVCPLNEGTALFTAAFSGNFGIMIFLIEQGINTHYINEAGTSALHYATKHNIEMIKFFLQLGSDINQNGESGTPLFWAARFGNIEAVKYLILNEANVNLASLEEPKTPMIAAAYYGHCDIVKVLLKNGAEVDFNSENYGTPLACAVQKGHFNVVEYLIKKNADINLESTEDGFTPLMIAILENNFHIVNIY